MTLLSLLKGLFIDFADRMAVILRDMMRMSDIDFLEDADLQEMAKKHNAPIPTTDNIMLRQIIRGKIASTNSQGKIQNMDNIIKLMSDDETITMEYYPSCIAFYCDRDKIAYPSVCLPYLRQAKPAGVTVIGITLQDSDTFYFNSSIMQDVGDDGDKMADLEY
jgi:hypothetical protein